jgi:hypothetical protein
MGRAIASIFNSAAKKSLFYFAAAIKAAKRVT